MRRNRRRSCVSTSVGDLRNGTVEFHLVAVCSLDHASAVDCVLRPVLGVEILSRCARAWSPEGKSRFGIDLLFDKSRQVYETFATPNLRHLDVLPRVTRHHADQLGGWISPPICCLANGSVAPVVVKRERNLFHLERSERGARGLRVRGVDEEEPAATGPDELAPDGSVAQGKFVERVNPVGGHAR